jgi:replication factor C subunit 1
MKLDPTSPKPDKKADENTSPNPVANNKMSNMMKNWLTKSASKTAASDTTNKPATKTKDEPSKKVDSDSQKVSNKKVPESEDKTKKTTKTETKPVAETSSTSAKSKKTIESKEEKIPSKSKSKKEDSSPEVESKSKSKKSASDKLDETTSPKNKDKKAGGSKYYAAYMRREGPKNPGSKPIPIGKKGCFKDLKFLTTGVLDSLNRDQVKDIIEKYGGAVISGVTKKLDYLIVGEDAGNSKLEKARELNVRQLNEDEFLKLICTKSGITEPKYEGENEETEKYLGSSQEEQATKREVKDEKMDIEDDVVKPKSSKLKKLAISDDEDVSDTVTSKDTTNKQKTPVKTEKVEEKNATTKIEVLVPEKVAVAPKLEKSNYFF